MEESIHRFNVMLGVNESDEKTKECMNEVFGTSNDESDKSDATESVEIQGDEVDTNDNSVEINTNSNKHPKVSVLWSMMVCTLLFAASHSYNCAKKMCVV